MSVNAFTPSRLVSPLKVQHPSTKTSSETASSLILFSDSKKKGGLDGNMRNKLLSESIAPWRTIRLFLYGALGSGAFIGGLINISGAIAGSNSPEFNLNTEVSVTRETASTCRCDLLNPILFIAVERRN